MEFKYLATKSKLPVDIKLIKAGYIEAENEDQAFRKLRRQYRNVLIFPSAGPQYRRYKGQRLYDDMSNM